MDPIRQQAADSRELLTLAQPKYAPFEYKNPRPYSIAAIRLPSSR